MISVVRFVACDVTVGSEFLMVFVVNVGTEFSEI